MKGIGAAATLAFAALAVATAARAQDRAVFQLCADFSQPGMPPLQQDFIFAGFGFHFVDAGLTYGIQDYPPNGTALAMYRGGLDISLPLISSNVDVTVARNGTTTPSELVVTAFDAAGAAVATQTVVLAVGDSEVVSLSAPGIASIQVRGSSGAGGTASAAEGGLQKVCVPVQAV